MKARWCIPCTLTVVIRGLVESWSVNRDQFVRSHCDSCSSAVNSAVLLFGSAEDSWKGDYKDEFLWQTSLETSNRKLCISACHKWQKLFLSPAGMNLSWWPKEGFIYTRGNSLLLILQREKIKDQCDVKNESSQKISPVPPSCAPFPSSSWCDFLWCSGCGAWKHKKKTHTHIQTYESKQQVTRETAIFSVFYVPVVILRQPESICRKWVHSLHDILSFGAACERIPPIDSFRTANQACAVYYCYSK